MSHDPARRRPCVLPYRRLRASRSAPWQLLAGLLWALSPLGLASCDSATERAVPEPSEREPARSLESPAPERPEDAASQKAAAENLAPERDPDPASEEAGSSTTTGDARSTLHAQLVPPGAGAADQPGAERASSGDSPRPAGDGPLQESVPPEQRLDESKAHRAFDRLADELGRAIAAGDRAEAERHLLSEADLPRVFRQTASSIVGSTLIATNRKTLGQLVDSLGGQDLTRGGRPGPVLYASPKGLLREHLPVMRQAQLDLILDGALVSISIPQLVWIGEGWKIFQIEL